MKLPIIGFLAITATASALAANFDDYARVVNVQERYSNNAPVSSTRTVCEPVQQQAQSGGYGAGTAIGAVAGGLIGSQVGKGNGRIAGAAVGAATGAMAGHYMEGQYNQPSQPQQRCYQTNDGYSNGYDGGGRRPIGYTVTYERSSQKMENKARYAAGCLGIVAFAAVILRAEWMASCRIPDDHMVA